MGSEVTYPAAERKGNEGTAPRGRRACGDLCHLSDRALVLRVDPAEMEQTVPADLTARLRALSGLSTDHSA